MILNCNVLVFFKVVENALDRANRNASVYGNIFLVEQRGELDDDPMYDSRDYLTMGHVLQENVESGG
jgi:hypothetical protein